MEPLLAPQRAAVCRCKHRVCEIDQHHFTLVQRRGREGKRDEKKKGEKMKHGVIGNCLSLSLSLSSCVCHAQMLEHTHTYTHAHTLRLSQ